jgi:hypothetical protein
MRFRPEADIFPLLGEDELKALAVSIDQSGQRETIKLYQGDILDGRNRYLAITRHCKPGVEPKFEDVSPDSPIAYVIDLNEQRRHLNDSQRKMAAARALPFFEVEAKKRMLAGVKMDPEADLPQGRAPQARDEAGSAFGVPGRGVQQAKAVQKAGSRKLVEAVDRGVLSLSKAEQIVREQPDKKAQDAEVQAIAESKMVTRVRGLTGEVEWYTPGSYLDAAVAVMGGIDLDPASSEAAQNHVGATAYFTRDDDGLAQRWYGRVFLNPPYAMPTIREFTAKMVTSWTDGDMDEGILLTNNATDTEWFHMAARACAAVCFTRGRISFLQARDGELLEKTAPTHGQAFFYFGPKGQVFEKVFSQHGIVLVRAGSV